MVIIKLSSELKNDKLASAPSQFLRLSRTQLQLFQLFLHLSRRNLEGARQLRGFMEMGLKRLLVGSQVLRAGWEILDRLSLISSCCAKELRGVGKLSSWLMPASTRRFEVILTQDHNFIAVLNPKP